MTQTDIDTLAGQRNRRPEPILFLSDARGIYIPRDFADDIRHELVENVDEETWETLSNPDHEWYWDAWQDVCDSAIITDDDGIKWTIHQDGDCWLIPVGMVWNDRDEFYSWDDGESDDDGEEN